MKDRIVGNRLYHPVKKIWRGIVSCGSYTVDKCRESGLDLVLVWDGREMTIPLIRLQRHTFFLHKKTIPSKYNRPYTMYDFHWKPDPVSKEKQLNFLKNEGLSN